MVNTAQMREDTLSGSTSWLFRPGPADFLSHQAWGSFQNLHFRARRCYNPHTGLQPSDNLWEETEAQGGGQTDPASPCGWQGWAPTQD